MLFSLRRKKTLDGIEIKSSFKLMLPKSIKINENVYMASVMDVRN